MKSIEIVGMNDTAGVSELAAATYANQEPGYQIDNVDDSDKLLHLIELLRLAAPVAIQDSLNFNDASTSKEIMAIRYDRNYKGDPFHFDGGFKGLAIHQNLADEIPVTLAIQSDKKRTLGSLAVECESIRTGITIPGRLTIFSEGWEDGLTIKKTGHHFDRSKSKEFANWVRYTSTIGSHPSFPEERIKKVIDQAFIDLREGYHHVYPSAEQAVRAYRSYDNM